jgi:hypothetical protein
MSYNFTNNGIEEITRLENSVSDTNYENIARSRSLRFSGYANWVSIAQTVAHNIPALENNIHLQTPEITLQGKA